MFCKVVYDHSKYPAPSSSFGFGPNHRGPFIPGEDVDPLTKFHAKAPPTQLPGDPFGVKSSKALRGDVTFVGEPTAAASLCFGASDMRSDTKAPGDTDPGRYRLRQDHTGGFLKKGHSQKGLFKKEMPVITGFGCICPRGSLDLPFRDDPFGVLQHQPPETAPDIRLGQNTVQNMDQTLWCKFGIQALFKG